MPGQHKALAACLAVLLTGSGNCTPLIVGRSGNHILVATNSIDTEGNSHCKVHFAKTAVVMRATQAASAKFTWPDGHAETVDFDAALNDRIRDLDEPVDRLKDILVQDAEQHIRAALELYKAEDPKRIDIAHDLVSEYVIVGREHNGFLGVRAFTLEVVNPRAITFRVSDLAGKLHDGEVVDYTEGERKANNARGMKDVRATIDNILQNHNEAAQHFGNKSFSPPYLVMDVTHSDRRFLTDPGPCHN